MQELEGIYTTPESLAPVYPRSTEWMVPQCQNTISSRVDIRYGSHGLVEPKVKVKLRGLPRTYEASTIGCDTMSVYEM